MRLAIVVLGIVILVAAMPLVFGDTLTEGAQPNQISKENFDSPSGGDIITLSESNRDDVLYNSSVEVFDENNNLVEESGNYTWFDNNGTLRITTGGELDGDTNGSVTYGYLDTEAGAIDASNTLGQVASMLGMALPLLFVLVLIVALVG